MIELIEERKEFHAYMVKRWPSINLNIRSDGSYWDHHDDAWEIWKARSLLSSNPQDSAISNSILIDWNPSDDPLLDIDVIYSLYSKTFGKTAPDAEMTKIVIKCQYMLFTWWATHRDVIRKALLSQDSVTATKTMFVAAVAQRKWNSLLDEGYCMQHISFTKGERIGKIDAWGVVAWDIATCKPQPVIAPELNLDQYYVQDRRSFVGNDMLFWALGGGYTTDVSKAEVFTYQQAQNMQRSRDTDTPWPKNYIDRKTRPAVDSQYIKLKDADALMQRLHAQVAASSQPMSQDSATGESINMVLHCPKEPQL
jgi:hypothetical protein